MWFGSVAIQNVITEPLVIAPANAQTRTAAIGCVEPNTAPNRPVTMAKTGVWVRTAVNVARCRCQDCCCCCCNFMSKKISGEKTVFFFINIQLLTRSQQMCLINIRDTYSQNTYKNKNTHPNRIDCQTLQSLDSAATMCIQCPLPIRSKIQRHAGNDSPVWHIRCQTQQPLSIAVTAPFPLVVWCMTDFALHSMVLWNLFGVRVFHARYVEIFMENPSAKI